MVRKAAVAPAGQTSNMVRLTLHGTMNSVQSWSTSFWFDYAVGTTVPSAINCVLAMTNSDELEGFIETFQGLLVAQMAPYTTFTTWSVLAYGEGALNPAEGVAQHPVPLAGTSTTILPPEVAVVASLVTAQTGQSHRGRSYLPTTGVHADPTGSLSPVTAQAIATYVANLLSSINGHTFIDPTGIGLAFSLSASVNSVQLGVSTRIVAVRVDTRFDAQRRREDKLIGTISQVNLH